jgi:hypothetical protein
MQYLDFCGELFVGGAYTCAAVPTWCLPLRSCEERDLNLAMHLWNPTCLTRTRLILCVAVFMYFNWGEVLEHGAQIKGILKVLPRGAYGHVRSMHFHCGARIMYAALGCIPVLSKF